ITFQKVGGTKTFSILMADASIVQMKNHKVKQGIIAGYTDSSIVFKEGKFTKESIPALKALNRDKSLTKEQKMEAFMKITHPDSVSIPYDSIKKIKINLTGDKKYSFQTKSAFALFLTLDFLTIADVGFITNPDNGMNDNSIAKNNKAGLEIIPFAFAISSWYYTYVITKTIKTSKWKLKSGVS
ncbi:MAG TPA: hypothetical protein VNY36_09030, partial [Bacteroidia bacterium]|nr:hypothetical protein [Bacteroidia bacterium]